MCFTTTIKSYLVFRSFIALLRIHFWHKQWIALILFTAVLWRSSKASVGQTPSTYRGTISLYSFRSPLAPTTISVPSSPAMLEPSPVQPFSPPPTRSWHAMASWEDTKIPLHAEVRVMLSSALLCSSGVGAGALIPLLPAPSPPPVGPPLGPHLLGGGPQRKACAGL